MKVDLRDIEAMMFILYRLRILSFDQMWDIMEEHL